MRIALVTHNVVKGDGQGRINYEIAWAALRRGHRVILLASVIAPELGAHPSASWVRVPTAGWPSELLRSHVYAWRTTRWLRRHGHEVDIVHANGFTTWTASDVNTANFVHGAWLRSPAHVARLRRDLYGVYQWLYTALNARLEKRVYRLSKVVVPYSKKTLEELAGIGIPADAMRYIPAGVDLDEFSPGAASRSEAGLPDRVPLALFVGDIKTPRKNLDTVLRSLVEVPELHLVVVGATSGSPYPRMAEQLGLVSRTHFLGYRRDVSRLMRAVDLFVFPSRYEPFGLVVLEAMASGLPVVTASTTGAADLLSPECGVVLQDPDDAGALATALERLVQHPEGRKRMGRAARVVAEQHSWQRMAEQYLQVYDKIATRSGSPRRDRSS